MKKLFFILGVLLCSIGLYPQYNAHENQYPNVIPTSPMAQSIQKFLGYPVSPSTGLIDISIPLFSLKTKNVDLISELKYHSSGIKITDTSGIVGYGWSIFPNSRVYRTVNGKPDEKSPVILPEVMTDQVSLLKISEPQNNELLYAGSEYPDGQYDIFTVSLPDESVSFYLSYTGNSTNPYVVNKISSCALEITPLIKSESIYGFYIRDAKGIDYYFGESGYIPPQSSSNYIEFADFGYITTSWVLREIKQDGETMNFNYTKAVEMNYASQYSTLMDYGNTFWFQGGGDRRWDYTSLTGGHPYYATLDNTTPGNAISSKNSCVLSKISTSNYVVDFTYKDVSSTKKLDNIKVSQVKSGSTPAKTIRFYYKNDIFLESVSINDVERYSFKYDEQSDQLSKTAIDWWGYFNGKVSNKNAIPNVTFKVVDLVSNYNGKEVVMGQADRTPDAAKMQAKSLTQVTYPTGGHLKINYEANSVNIGNESKVGPGLRVSSTENYDPVSKQTITNTYSYEEPVFMSPQYPDKNLYITESILCTFDRDLNGSYNSLSKVCSRTVSSISPYPYISDGNAKVYYKKVTKTTGESKTVYTYDIIQDEFTDGVDMVEGKQILYPYLINSYTQLQPLLIKEEKYKKVGTQYKPVEKNNYSYKWFNYGTVKQLLCKPKHHAINMSTNPTLLDFLLPNGWGSGNMYATFASNKKIAPILITNEFSFSKGDFLLAKQTKESYTDNSDAPIVETVEYTYDIDRIYNVSKKTTTCSDNSTIIEKFYYPNNEYPSKSKLSAQEIANIKNMDAANYKKAVIEHELYKGSTFRQSMLYSYKPITSQFYLPLKAYRIFNDKSSQCMITYDKYDSGGNIIQYTTPDGISTIYLWSYNGQYPVAEIKNATYDAVKTALGNVTPESLSSSTSPNINQIENLRNHTLLKDSYITTYTYKPLIGMLTMTDTSGKTTNYEYDSFGRLTEVYIRNNTGVKEILESYKYNYVNK